MQEYARKSKELGFIPALDAQATVFKSDSIISTQLKEDIRVAASPLEKVSEMAKDWHPYSDETVLDLVHPSLFPLLYGVSRVLKPKSGYVLGDSDRQWEGKGGSMTLDDCEQWIGKGGIMPVPEDAATQVSSWAYIRRSSGQHFYSTKFQWLPCEVAFVDEDSVKVTSYINNLHPKKHKELYEVLERVIARTIPMWNTTLESTQTRDKKPRIDLDGIPWLEQKAKKRLRGRSHASTSTAYPGSNEKESAHEEYNERREANRTLIPPEPDFHSTPGIRSSGNSGHTTIPIDLRKTFADHGLQVIVKLANIHLSPEKPSYDGGTWHIEGQLNEHICASAIYYYDSDNITDSYLSFRETTCTDELEDKPYEQDDHTHFERLYGIHNNDPAVQELGSVLTREGRLLTFPNVLQHRVSSFSLADKTRPGHRKILALFLVDPYTRIPSTANVPPQQKEWWKEMVHGLDRVNKLPAELQEWITDSAGDFPLTLEEAKKIRAELMDERRLFVEDFEGRVRQESYSFCEH
jgi:hypothetical protein